MVMPLSDPDDNTLFPGSDTDFVDSDNEDEDVDDNNEDDNNDDGPRPLYVFVTAHPDDESMFFLPTLCAVRAYIRTIRRRSHRHRHLRSSPLLWLVCFTRGNYNDLGSIRATELQCACHALGIDELFLLNHPDMPDHPTREWHVSRAANVFHHTLSQALLQHCSSATPLSRTIKPGQVDATTVTTAVMHIVTFDDGGVSGHVNHRDTFRTVAHWATTTTMATMAVDQDGDCPNDEQYSRQRPSSPTTTMTRTSRRTMLTHPTRPHISWNVRIWTLETIRNPFVKYLPIVEWIRLVWLYCACYCGFHLAQWWWWWCWRRCWWCLAGTTTNDSVRQPPKRVVPNKFPRVSWTCENSGIVTVRLYDPVMAWQTLALHESQFVWYRRLSILFSRYTYVNRLRQWRCPSTAVTMGPIPVAATTAHHHHHHHAE